MKIPKIISFVAFMSCFGISSKAQDDNKTKEYHSFFGDPITVTYESNSQFSMNDKNISFYTGIKITPDEMAVYFEGDSSSVDTLRTKIPFLMYFSLDELLHKKDIFNMSDSSDPSCLSSSFKSSTKVRFESTSKSRDLSYDQDSTPDAFIDVLFNIRIIEEYMREKFFEYKYPQIKE